ncbi:MAG: hypothetical protein HC837_10040 [Chloroflexaceae bacterium]|nr:hypothetical protein [Chloroflexaceae bacterium]
MTPTPANESLLEETDQILFVSDRDGNQEIYRANADGSGLARLTDNRAADTDPIWSPDGQQIAFVSQRDGPDELYTMNLNGLDIERLTRFEAEVAQPTWSPDGTQIAFALHDDDTSVLAALDLESGTVMTISDRLQSIANPAWSPDGTMIAFASTDETVDQKRDIFRIDIRSPDESASLVNLTNHLGDDDHPAWQPVRANTARIAFHSNRDGNDEIYVMEANGAAQTRLTRNRTADTGPSWSSTGTAIAFTTGRTRESNSEIVVMRDDGSEQRSIIAFAARNEQVAWQPPPKIRRVNQLAFTLSNQPPLTSRNIVTMNEGGGSLAFVTNNLDVDTTTPAWSPDGSQIAFASNQSGNYDIWVINADGSGEARNLTGSFAARDMHPAWSPDGSEIAFESREPGNWDVFDCGSRWYR